MPPSRHKLTVLAQICKLIPRNLVATHGVDREWRTLDPWSHARQQTLKADEASRMSSVRSRFLSCKSGPYLVSGIRRQVLG